MLKLLNEGFENKYQFPRYTPKKSLTESPTDFKINRRSRKHTEVDLPKSKKLKESPMYDMSPQYDSRQSFYGKARVDDNGSEKTLYSYNTPVAKIVNNKVELLPKWDWSQTTLRHIKEFLKQNGFEATSLAQIRRDYL